MSKNKAIQELKNIFSSIKSDQNSTNPKPLELPSSQFQKGQNRFKRKSKLKMRRSARLNGRKDKITK